MTKSQKDFSTVMQAVSAGEAMDRTSLATMIIAAVAATIALGTAASLII